MAHVVPAEEPASGPAAWIRLAETPGVGLETARKLLAWFGLPENIFSASPAALRELVPDRIATIISAPPSAEIQQLIARTLEWTAQPQNRLCTLADSDYPTLLLNIPDPPLMLYIKGRVELLTAPSVAIVGSRNATAQGILNAEKFSQALSEAGWHTISGLALGIDAAAHRGSLSAHAKNAQAGSTVAIIGTGIDIVYPARNRDLAHQIAAAGCIVSEYSLGTPAIASNFPRRNRIISGLARGTLVVEAAAQSGSLITARMATEQGRDVFAIPGSIHSPLAKGCHQLIKQGAKLVETAQDILEEMGAYSRQATEATQVAALSDSEALRDPILAALGFEAMSTDSLGARCGLDTAALTARLVSLELEGKVEMLPDGSYQRLH